QRRGTAYMVSRHHQDRHLMIANAPFAPKNDCHSCRADPFAAGACASLMLRTPGVTAGPRQIDYWQQPNQRFAACGVNNHCRPRRSHRRPQPRAADKSP
ncbi:hypothetical protein, partial [Mesorhizobium tianshanense]|uniref:hypothetical protein n=2 Tax=Mesorhizobium tianshanense TaxID=39844 RepID=UPI001ABF02FD